MIWGTELWDGYDKVVSHVTLGATALGSKYEKFFREKFLPYKFRPHANLEEIARMADQLDPNTDILSRL